MQIRSIILTPADHFGPELNMGCANNSIPRLIIGHRKKEAKGILLKIVRCCPFHHIKKKKKKRNLSCTESKIHKTVMQIDVKAQNWELPNVNISTVPPVVKPTYPDVDWWFYEIIQYLPKVLFFMSLILSSILQSPNKHIDITFLRRYFSKICIGK